MEDRDAGQVGKLHLTKDQLMMTSGIAAAETKGHQTCEETKVKVGDWNTRYSGIP